MSRKVYNLIVAVLGGATAIASGVVAYLNPSYVPAIVAAIPLHRQQFLRFAACS